MRPGLQLKISQQLTMTPQLQQAIRLLQLSTLELRQEVIEQLYNNPLLEMDEENSRPVSDKEENSNSNQSDNDVDFNSDDPSHHQAAADATEQTVTDAEADHSWEQTNSQELAVDASWDEVYSGPSTASGSGGEVNIEQVYQVTESLQDHLHWQLNLTPLSDRDREIAEALIDAIDDNGLLNDDLREITTHIEPNLSLIHISEPTRPY